MRGSWTYRLDDKSRVTLPAKYKTELTEDVTVIQEAEHCLSVYPSEVYNTMISPVEDASGNIMDMLTFGQESVAQRAKAYIRFMESAAWDTKVDKQGRIILTADQREHAQLSGDVVVIGVGNHLEIWNPEKWLATRNDLNEVFVKSGVYMPRS